MTYGTNGLPVTEPWSVNLIDVPRAIAQAKAMHRDGVDVVMVAIHAGTEYLARARTSSSSRCSPT